MTVQPNAFTASVAGTQRAAVRSGDADAANAQAASRQSRAENPGGLKEGVGQVERDAATGDSGADGRQLLHGRDPQGNPDHSDDDDHSAARHSISKDGTGAVLDFDA